MIFTLYYIYATVMQWWRLRTLVQKLSHTLNENNALLVCKGSPILLHNNRKHCLENLLLKSDNRVGCTIIPKKKLNLNQWIAFPKNLRFFPIYIDQSVPPSGDFIFVMLQTILTQYTKHDSEIIQIEHFGELVGWKVGDFFEVIIKTDITLLTKLVHHFFINDVDINHELPLLKIETVDIEGVPIQIKYEKKYLKEQTLKYSYAPHHWNEFVRQLKELYGKIRDVTNPKITIENGNSKSVKIPKIIKKENPNKLDIKQHKKRQLVKQKSVIKKVDSKPPNVLVYSDNITTRDNLKRLIYSILNKESYTIYDFPNVSTGWQDSTVLVVIAGNLPSNLTPILIQFYLNGGRLLSICSDFLYSVLHTYTTAEVREHELVGFTYGNWRSVKMMHHVFCYQASPAKKQFSRESDGYCQVAPSCVDLYHNDKEYKVEVEVLGAEETWQTPSLMLAKAQNGGVTVFSQVHLEIEPEVYENDDEKFQQLSDSNTARIEIFRDILERHLSINCDLSFGKISYSLGYFLGRYDEKISLLSKCENITNNQLNCDKISITFCGHNVDPGPASSIKLPVLIHSCPTKFSTLRYFETLETEEIGRLIIYSDILTSSQFLLTKKLRHGLVVIAKQQTNGVGRSNNTWLSPNGSACFSLQLHVPLHSNLGGFVSLVQHLIMTAIVTAFQNHGYNINLGIKWPNDLYSNQVKIGGVIVNSILYADEAIVNIGCGVNLSNKKPTISINELIENLNLKPLEYEKYFAIVFNEIERLYRDVQQNGFERLYSLYYENWLHNNAEITIFNEKGESQKAKIVGIDSYGFLKVQAKNDVIVVQPDGNTFDLLNGLIAPKQF